jgi:hypothetical protein
MLNFWLWNEKNWGFECAEGKGRQSMQDAWSVAKNCYKRFPLMCEVRGVIAMAEIHYNSQKWSSEDPAGRASLL